MNNIVTALRTLLPDVGVQLQHDNQETSWESHGYIIINDSGGSLIYDQTDYQHNRKYSEQRSQAQSIAEVVKSYMDAKETFALSARKERIGSDTTDDTIDSNTTEEEEKEENNEKEEGVGEEEKKLAGLSLATAK